MKKEVMQPSYGLDVEPHTCEACGKQWYGLNQLSHKMPEHKRVLCYSCYDECRDFIDKTNGWNFRAAYKGDGGCIWNEKSIAICEKWIPEHKRSTPNGRLDWNGETSVKAWKTYFTKHPKGHRMGHFA